MPGAVFQNSWTKDPLFKDWVKSTDNKHEAYCILCKKTIDIKTMGRSALTSHSQGKGHRSIIFAKSKSDSQSLKDFVTPSTSSSSTNIAAASNVKHTGSESMDTYLSKTDTIDAEIWWCVRTALKNYSAHSNDDIDFYLKQMFPEVKALKKFSCAETKTMYMMVYGLAPHFRSILVDDLCDQPFSLLFDESLNKSVMKKQLDIHVRFFRNGNVVTRYLDSQMLGHSKASDLLDALNSCRDLIPFQNLTQLSMDGPNVNWALFKQFSEQLSRDHGKKLWNIGSCGLHQVHNAFRKGVEVCEWELENVLRSLYWLFKDVPARREDFVKVTSSSVFPLKFCAHRWVENQKCMMRMKEMIPNLRIYIKAVRYKTIPDPKTQSFTVIKTFLQDKLAESKLAFAISLTKPIEKFLTLYQTDFPLVPFLYEDLKDLVSVLAEKIVKTNVLSEQTVLHINFSDTDNFLEGSKIDVGTETKELVRQSGSSPKDLLAFRLKCRDCISTIISKLIVKSPLQYSLSKYLKFLSPAFIKSDKEGAKTYLKKSLISTEHCKLDEVDEILDEFRHFCRCSNERFLQFDRRKHRLDELYFQEMSCSPETQKLWEFVKKCLTLSHGQASVERGFSINKEVLETNMGPETLIARRMIKDHIQAIGGIKNFSISKKLRQSCCSSHRKYSDKLEERKAVDHSGKRKHIEEEVVVLKKKKG